MTAQGLIRMLTLSLPLVLGSAGLAQDATVLSIGDGDTVHVRLARSVRTVRLACIDAPELAQQPWGQRARSQLQALLPIGSRVEVRSKTSDRYGRLVADLNHQGRNINQALMASGAAFVYWQFIRGCDRQAYSWLETTARLRRLWVWSVPGGIARPWDVRRTAGNVSRSPSEPRSGHHDRCREIGSDALARQLQAQEYSERDGAGDGLACKRLR